MISAGQAERKKETSQLILLELWFWSWNTDSCKGPQIRIRLPSEKLSLEISTRPRREAAAAHTIILYLGREIIWWNYKKFMLKCV